MTQEPSLHEALVAAREAAGRPKYDTTRLRMFGRLGFYVPTAETIRVMHTPKGPTAERVDLLVLAALCEVYGVDMETLHPVIPKRLQAARELLAPHGPHGGGSEITSDDLPKSASARNRSLLDFPRRSTRVRPLPARRRVA